MRPCTFKRSVWHRLTEATWFGLLAIAVLVAGCAAPPERPTAPSVPTPSVPIPSVPVPSVPVPVPVTPTSPSPAIPELPQPSAPVEPRPSGPPSSSGPGVSPPATPAPAPVAGASPTDWLYTCTIGGAAQPRSTPIEFLPRVLDLCRRHPEMGPCQYQRQLCRRAGGRVFTRDGQEITPAIEAEYDRKVMRVRFRGD